MLREQRNAQRTGPMPLSGPVKTAGLHSGFCWSHLWSHSCKFSGVRSGLPSLGSGATEPNRTGLNHQPQNSKAREGQPSAGSNPAATASRKKGSLSTGAGSSIEGSEVIRIIAGMPAGTIGLEAVGKVTDDDYRTVLLPAIEAALERNDVRLLYVLGEDSSRIHRGPMWADTKLWAQHLKAWQKVAIVSDADWLENSVKAFGWLVPGEVKVFETDDIDDAKEWLAGLDDEDD
jgi:hypothetical protein